jgi:hypothetical protein
MGIICKCGEETSTGTCMVDACYMSVSWFCGFETIESCRANII